MRNDAAKCSSVSRDLNFDFVFFILENSCSQQYVLPNGAVNFLASCERLVYLSDGSGCKKFGRSCSAKAVFK